MLGRGREVHQEWEAVRDWPDLRRIKDRKQKRLARKMLQERDRLNEETSRNREVYRNGRKQGADEMRTIMMEKACADLADCWSQVHQFALAAGNFAHILSTMYLSKAGHDKTTTERNLEAATLKKEDEKNDKT